MPRPSAHAVAIVALCSSAAALAACRGTTADISSAGDASSGASTDASNDRNDLDATGDAPGLTGDAPGTEAPDCGYADPHNDPACPAKYSPMDCYAPCSPVGLSCLYPGAGDIPQGNGCYGSAWLGCRANDAGDCTFCWDAGSWTCYAVDAGADAEIGHWVAAQ